MNFYMVCENNNENPNLIKMSLEGIQLDTKRNIKAC